MQFIYVGCEYVCHCPQETKSGVSIRYNGLCLRVYPLRVLIAMTSFRVALDVAAVVAVAAAAVGFLLGALTEVRPMYLVDSIDRRIACGGNTANLSKV